MRINVVVRPKSGKSEIIGEDNVYKASLKSVPEGGKANLELLKLLRKHFKKQARIVSGKTSKRKVVELF
ncbi:MAG: DUF167 domain-containing protein [Candidatus Woesearchaeota archaeon]